jgi:hypothetical protein
MTAIFCEEKMQVKGFEMLQVLQIKVGRDIPSNKIRDTAEYNPLMRHHYGVMRSRKLKALAQEQLGVWIQIGQHNSVDDARAALYIYHKHSRDWESRLQASNQHQGHRFAC